MDLTFSEILKMDWRHVKNRAFYARNLEKRLFDPEKVHFDSRAVAATWNTILVNCPSSVSLQKFTFKANEEKIMFLRVNYARMKTAQAISKFRSEPSLSARQEVMRWAEIAIDLRNTIIVANLGLILSVLKKKFGQTNTDAPDSISMGMASLIRAIEKFDVAKGFKFSTYAFRAIMNGIKRGYLDSQKHPSGIRIGNGEGEMVVADKKDYSENVDHRDSLCHLRDVLEKNLAGLSEQEEIIIRARFFSERTLQDIGDDINLSKERIRQLQNIALKKLYEAMKDRSSDSDSIPMFDPTILRKAS
jgi:RNA polymerase primary sigma factor